MKVLAGMVALAMAGAVHAEKLTPERVFADPDLSGPRARAVTLAPDGSAVTFLKAKSDDQRLTDLWIAPTDGAAPHLIIDGRALTPKGAMLSEDEKSRRERQGVQTRGVVDYSWDEAGKQILVPVEGDLWLYERADGRLIKLTDKPADDTDAKISPLGNFVSYVRGDNLYIMPTKGGAERALTSGGDDLQAWGVAEFIAQEEMARETGYWWSPDDTRIALTHVDVRGVDVVPRLDIGPEGASVVNDPTRGWISMSRMSPAARGSKSISVRTRISIWPASTGPRTAGRFMSSARRAISVDWTCSPSIRRRARRGCWSARRAPIGSSSAKTSTP